MASRESNCDHIARPPVPDQPSICFMNKNDGIFISAENNQVYVKLAKGINFQLRKMFQNSERTFFQPTRRGKTRLWDVILWAKRSLNSVFL